MGTVKTCIAKVGEPNLTEGMEVCGRPAFFANAGDIIDGRPAMYTGWRHVYDEAGHHAVPEGWA
jgi:hypothetical protein